MKLLKLVSQRERIFLYRFSFDSYEWGAGRIRVLLPTVDRRGNRLPRFSALSFIRIWCLGQRHYGQRSWAIDRPKFCPFFASRPYRRRDAHFFGRLIFRRTRHININSMYEICQNEFRLGVAAPNHHFSFPRRMRSWCEISLYYCADTWGVSGRSIPASAFSR